MVTVTLYDLHDVQCLVLYAFFSLGYGFIHILKAATSPTKKLEEDSLTYLNQGIHNNP